MTFQLQAYKAKAILYAGANRNFTEQQMDFLIVSANTDVNLDIANDTSGSLGTFWTAVTADATYGTLATNALATMQSIVSNCSRFRSAMSEALISRTKIGSGAFQTLVSSSIPSGTSVNAVVTGLLATDTIVSVDQSVANANSVTPVAWGTPAANALPLTYASTSGTGGAVSVLIFRGTGTLTIYPGQYGLSLSNHLPLITFNSGTAPTTQILTLSWRMQDGVLPINADAGAAF
jgi:hypothetical protein